MDGMTEPDVSYYPPKGAAMSLSLADVCLIIIAVCAVIIVIAGANAI
jgi:hypothetical protein